MRQFLGFIFLTSCMFYSQRASSQSSAEAVEYMNSISIQYSDIQKETWNYISTFAKGRSARKIEKNRMALLKTMHKALQNIKTLPPFDNDASLRDTVISVLTMDFNVLNNDFAQIVNMEEISEQSYDAMEAYFLAKEAANKKLEIASGNMEQQYESFAAKYGVKLVENSDKMSLKLQRASEALKYYDEVYLVFFKAYKQELYLFDAIGRNDINAIEQNRNALAAVSEEGLVKLTEISHFKGDNSINASCKRLLMFYDDEAKTKIPVIADFLQVVEEYNKMVAMYKSKDRMLLTNEEVDKYNEAVNNYNKGLNKYQTTSNTLTNKRKAGLDAWNNSISSYMERHVSAK